MIYFSFRELWNAMALSVTYGACVGLVYAHMSVLISVAVFLSKFPNRLRGISKNPQKVLRFSKFEAVEKHTKSSGEMNILDFSIVLIYGLGLNVLFYAACDGMIRLYPIFISCLSAVLFYKMIGKRIERIWARLLYYAIEFIRCFFALALYFVMKISSSVVKRSNLILSKRCNVRKRNMRILPLMEKTNAKFVKKVKKR
jgi:hypothetical protein